MQLKTIPLSLPLLAALALDAGAQVSLYRLHGPPAAGDFGRAIAPLGDVDGDGHEDFAVGMPWLANGGPLAGGVRVFSGRTGALLLEIQGAPEYKLGHAIARAADLDGDGRADIAIGAPGYASAAGEGAGAVFIHSSVDGSLLRTLQSSPGSAYELFGHALADVGDIDQDGVIDLAVGAPGFDLPSGLDAGKLFLFSGVDGSLIESIVGTVGEQLGAAVSSAGDFDGDGQPDVLIGAPGWKPAGSTGAARGKALVLSPQDSIVIASWLGLADGDRFGSSVAGIGDVDGDGRDDVIIGAPHESQWGQSSGKVYLFRGGEGLFLYERSGFPQSQFGLCVAALGDVDGDGRPDFAVGAPYHGLHLGQSVGALRVYSGANGNQIFSFFGEAPGDRTGFAAAGIDVNGDGLRELALGSPTADQGALLDTGAVEIFYLGSTLPAAYCSGKQNSLGCLPAIDATGMPSLAGADNFHVRAHDVRNRQSGQLFFGNQPQSLPFQGGTLCVTPPLVRTTVHSAGGSNSGSDCSGSYDFHFSQALMVQHGMVPGSKVYAQFWSRDPGDAFGIGLTDALEFTVLP